MLENGNEPNEKPTSLFVNGVLVDRIIFDPRCFIPVTGDYARVRHAVYVNLFISAATEKIRALCTTPEYACIQGERIVGAWYNFSTSTGLVGQEVCEIYLE